MEDRKKRANEANCLQQFYARVRHLNGIFNGKSPLCIIVTESSPSIYSDYLVYG